MDIYYLGHSSFRIKSKDVVVVTDPFDPKMVGIKFPSVEADIVTISHDHNDHNQHELIKNVRKVISGPGEYEVGGVSIVGVQTYHDDKKGAERGKNTIYVIETEGMRLAHLGDLGHSLNEDALEALGEIDILFVPVGGHYTIDAKTAVEVAMAIEPSFIIPMHYNTTQLNQENFSNLTGVDNFLEQIGLTTEKLPKLSVKSSDLSDDKKVVILETK